MENMAGPFLDYLKQFGVASDMRVSNWPLMHDVVNVTVICVGYVAIVKYLGPWLMKNRDGFELKSILKIYNILQILFCGILVFRIVNELEISIFDIECDAEHKDSIEAKDILWWTMCLKNFEMLETVFFVMRKKQSQVSFLHVYHHSSTFLLAWVGVKYYGAQVATLYVVLNCLVHIIMYSYYTLAASGNPRIKTEVVKYKKYITRIQMVQFSAILCHVGLVYKTCEDAPVILVFMFFTNVVFIFYLFFYFYKQNYISNKCKKN